MPVQKKNHVITILSIAVIFTIAAPAVLTAQAMSGIVGFADSYEGPIPMVGVNSVENEYGPVWQKEYERLLVTTDRSGWPAIWQVPYEQGSGGEMPAHPMPVEGTFNEPGRSRSYVSFGYSGEGVGVAFVLRGRQAWPTIVSVPTDNTALNLGHEIQAIVRDGFDSQPALSPDGTRLVYVSDREGGAGGLDLWVCERRSDREWDTPVLLSRTINSEGDEITPFFASNDSLIYASNGYGGKGGFDLFLSVFRNGIWQEPEPLDVLNTEFNETDPAVLPDGTIVFASDRPGGMGKLDVWMAKRKR